MKNKITKKNKTCLYYFVLTFNILSRRCFLLCFFSSKVACSSDVKEMTKRSPLRRTSGLNLINNCCSIIHLLNSGFSTSLSLTRSMHLASSSCNSFGSFSSFLYFFHILFSSVFLSLTFNVPCKVFNN